MNVELKILAEEFRKDFWFHKPYRHAQLAMLFVNDTGRRIEQFTFEILVPEETMFDLSGDAWNPSHKHDVAGVVFDVWDNLGGLGRFAGIPGMIFSPGARYEEKLGLNLKAKVQSIEVRWRLFEFGDPTDGYGKQELPFKHSFQPFSV